MKRKDLARRMMIELERVLERFRTKIRYHRDLRWLMIYGFPLPQGFNYEQTTLLIFLPALYPLLPPTGFAIRVSDDLTKGGKSLKGLTKDGWLYFTLGYEQEQWRPAADLASGDSLLTACNRIYEILQRFELQ